MRSSAEQANKKGQAQIAGPDAHARRTGGRGPEVAAA
jgi:hypothetical protein